MLFLDKRRLGFNGYTTRTQSGHDSKHGGIIFKHRSQNTKGLCSEDNHAYDCQRGESADDWVSACRNMEVVSVRGRAESGRPGAHISFFTSSLMKWCFGSNTSF